MKSQILQLTAHGFVLSAMSASAAIRYVNVNSASPKSPYTNWATAAIAIQDAVDAAVAGDQILVTNGIYQTGGRAVFGAMTNRVVVDKAVTVKSVSGASVTVIRGSQVPGTTNGDIAIRCVYLTNGAALVGFTITNGATRSSVDDQREYSGGGVWCESTSAVVSNCVLTGNSAGYGGGASGGTFNNCTISGNSATHSGGGAFGGTFNNCRLTGNSAHGNGGGVSGGTLNNCTLTANLAFETGGGAENSALSNCIVYYNSARIERNYSGYSSSYSCTTPLPPGGVGNISAEPLLADSFHLGAGSPCRGAGSASYATGLDIDGETWATSPSIGCDEYYPGAATGPLNVSIQAASTNVAVGFTVNFTASIDGHAAANRWEFDDGTLLSNRQYVSHTWAVAGDHLVVFRAYNDTYPAGISATADVHVVAQPVHYVALGSANPVSPYASWATAANNIQDAVDAASVAGAAVLVTNGVYQTGERVASEPRAIRNRVAVTKPLIVRSVNGAVVTLIQGYRDPAATYNSGSSVRCVYLANDAALVGFTLTNGAAGYGGGGGVWCESASAIVSNCVLTGNSAGSGGGASGGTLNSCTLSDNLAISDGAGGAVAGCTLNNCTLTRNSAGWLGGGAYNSTLNNSTLIGNSAAVAGGAYFSTLNNCMLTANSAASEGGGVAGCVLNNCTLTGNSANEGGGAYNSTLNNCIVYFNSAPNGDNYYYSRLSYSCTTPLPPEGVGNISAEPQLADLFHLSAGSPCRGAGSAAHATGFDIDGESWANSPSIGCDEYHPGAIIGLLRVSIQAAYTNVAVGVAMNFTAAIDGRATANRWDFGDGSAVSNRPYASHSWAVAGDSTVVFQAYNDTYPGGISATVTVHVVEQPIHYVALGSASPVAPYTSWATAADNIQDVVDAASVAGALVLVTNGIYRTGARAVSEVGVLTSNRVAVTKALIVRSVNGSAVTIIQGYRDPTSTYGSGGVRCVYLANGAALMGFTLINGAAGYGGGVWCESAGVIVSNCVLTGNSAYLGGGASGGTLNNCRLSSNSSTFGGGASGSTLNDCTLTNNSSSSDGGGANVCALNNCTLSGNSATNSGGGAIFCTLNNCVVYYNNAPSGPNYSDNSDYIVFNYSCTTPLATNGIANLTNAPLFINQAGGNLRLQSNSPCINAGSNGTAPAGPDLDGNPRIVGGTVDMGAYEFQSPQSLISYAWLQQYNLPTDGSADNTDADGDGLNNRQEWRTGTNPTNALSVLRLLSSASGGSGLTVSWQSVNRLNYILERGTDLGAQSPFLRLATDIVGQPGTTTFNDTNAVGAGPFFYRVGVRE